LNISLSPSVLERLSEKASKLGITPDNLVRAYIEQLVSQPADDFQKASDHVLNKNKELYQRLS
jgi:antitoxin FitA